LTVDDPTLPHADKLHDPVHGRVAVEDE